MRKLPVSILLAICAVLICTSGGAHRAEAALLYDASLQNGDYGGGFLVGTYLSSAPFNTSGSTGGDLNTLGIVDSPNGVTFTTNNDVINYSLGADALGGYKQSDFRTHGAVSIYFKADLNTFLGGQPFTDNYGFDAYQTGQGTFGTGMGRNAGADGTAGTADDQVEWWWSTWHSNVWYYHIDTTNDEVVFSFDQWHHIGLTWGGTTNHFEVWADGVLVATDNNPSSGAWGTTTSGGSAYNFSLGEIHERIYGNASPTGVTFADLEIWDEYRTFGNYQPQPDPDTIPEPSTFFLFGVCLLGTVFYGRKKRTK